MTHTFRISTYAITIILLLTLTTKSFAQSDDEKSDAKVLFDSLWASKTPYPIAKKKFDHLISQSQPSELPEAIRQASVYFFRFGELESAITYSRRSVDAAGMLEPMDSLSYRLGITNTGLFYRVIGQFEKALEQFKRVIDDPKVDKYKGRALERTGAIYRFNGDYYTALTYYQQARRIYESITEVRGLVYATVAIAELYDELKEENGIRKGRQLLEDLLSSDLRTQFEKQSLQDIYQVLGFLYNQKNYPDRNKALAYCQKALDIAQKRKDGYAIPIIQNNLALVYLETNPKKAYHILIEGMTLTEDPNIEGLFLHNLANYYHKVDSLATAITTMKRSIIQYAGLDQFSESIPVKQYQSSQNKRQILENFIFLIDYENQLLAIDPDMQYQHIATAELLLEHIRFESDDQQAKLYWQEQGSKLYQQAIKAAYLARDPEKAFYYMEKSKAILLLDGVSDRILKNTADLPTAILNEEKALKKQIFSFQDQYLKETTNQQMITDSIDFYKRQYYTLIDSLRDQYPKYYQYRASPIVKAYEEVQQSMAQEDVILEYALNETEGYGILIQKEDVKFFQLTDVPKLNDDVIALKQYLASPILLQKDLKDYQNLAFAVFSTLFPTEFLDLQSLSGKKITIIPDYNLQNLPFEALTTAADGNLGEAYLINDFEFSYDYSISFKKENRKIDRGDKSISISGFAPIQFEDERLSNLKGSEIEIEEVTSLLSGKSFLRDMASKQNFFEYANQSDIVHLSTHANASDSISPWIAFADDRLSLNEIYTATINAEMVMLSACNSAQGKVRRGEGVMSLARGFFLAGANSVVCSLWNVDDRSGQEITTNFYRYLQENETRSAALRSAKLNFLKQHSLSEISPFYWSSLIIIGEQGTIKTLEQNNFWWLFYFAMAVTTTMIIALIIRKLKTNTATS